jgi:cytochrome c oxidase subunit 4
MATHNSPLHQQQQGGTETAASVHEEHHGEHPTLQVYYATFAALMVLLVVTLGAAMIDFSKINPAFAHLNVMFALAIAGIKIGIIMVFFMHLKYSSSLSRVFAVSGLIWLVILFVLMSMDFISRPWLAQ